MKWRKIFRFKKGSRGIASLGVTLLLGAIVIEIALAIAVLAYLLNFSNLGIRLSAEALAGAQAGIQEGFIRVIRNDYNNPNCLNKICSFSVGNVGVTVEFCEGGTGNCIGLDSRKHQITSTGSILGKKRKLIAIVEGGISTPMLIESIKEISL